MEYEGLSVGRLLSRRMSGIRLLRFFFGLGGARLAITTKLAKTKTRQFI
jgi:hypothetical protein